MISSATLNDYDIDAEAIERMLLQRISTGDRAALGQMYRNYHGTLCRLLSRLTRRSDIIDEIINDCFWIACRNADSFHGDSRVSTWILSIAYRCGLQALRQHDELGEDDALQGQSIDTSESGEDRELRDWLSKGFDHLPLNQRVAIELVYGVGYSLADVAIIMECPIDTVRARLLHARIKLLNVLST
jgi:RNA polymerase sigma-70 factor (ECF subfamily)